MEFDEIAKDFKNLKSRNYRKIWQSFMRKYNCDYVCELGVSKGDNFVEMIKHNPKLAVAVDAWEDYGVHPRKYDDLTQLEFDEQYEYFRNRVSNMPFVQIIRDYTVSAAKQFPDNYFDFVYVDANHINESCYSDLINWYPKVKLGKFLVGHDYKKGFGVVDAVNKFTKDNKLEIIRFGHSNWAVIKK